MIGLGKIFRTFLVLGSIGFGGAMPMLALIHQEVVERRKWISPSQFAEATAIGQTLPGPIAVDAVSYIGHRLRKWPGAIVATGAFILPSFVLMVLLSLLYFRHGLNPRAEGIFKGVGAAVVGLILAASIRMGKAATKDLSGFLLVLASFLLLWVFHGSILLIFGLGALLGILIHLHQGKRTP